LTLLGNVVGLSENSKYDYGNMLIIRHGESVLEEAKKRMGTATAKNFKPCLMKSHSKCF